MKKLPYILFFILAILIIISFLITFINPNVFTKPYYNNSVFEREYDQTQLSTNYQIKDFVERMIGYLPGEAKDMEDLGKINSTQSKQIIDNTNQAYNFYVSYKSSNNQNDLYKSLFYAQLALAYSKANPYITCANKVLSTSEKYYPLVYYLSKADRDTALIIQDTKKGFENFLGYTSYYSEDNKTILSKAQSTLRAYQDLTYRANCDQFELYIKQDYTRQSNWFIFKATALILIFIIGFIIGVALVSYQKNEKKIEKKISFINKIWCPRKIEDPTIESILKINSITAALIAFLSISLNIAIFNNWIIVGSIIISVLLVLLSILLGIISLNNKNEKLKLYCYRSFILGIGLFVIFFAYLLIGGIIAKFLENIGESARTYLNNQTIIR